MKTAEYDKVNHYIDMIMKEPLSSEKCFRIFKEFAAQEVAKEVEAYKERLKDTYRARYDSVTLPITVIINLIDKTK